MNQLSLFEAAPQASAVTVSTSTPEDSRPKCENMECDNKALPGRTMCRACAELFSPMTREKLLGWRGE